MALIDFGLCAEVPLPDTKNMTLAIVHLMQGDVPGLLNDSIELGFLPHDVDKTKLLPALQKVFDDAQLAMKEEFQNQFKYKAVQSRRKRFMAVSTGKKKSSLRKLGPVHTQYWLFCYWMEKYH